ncbi:MAG: gamma-glutamylcyclotransferase [Armatimonadetes bacterium]|nr:gamma-glutamylcyclotransferase [Akkermansiaceae bacterium]
MKRNAVFVYGTLRKGGSNHFRMAGCEGLGRGKIFGKMYRIDWYPALVCGGGSGVRGEVYEVSDEDLRALDFFEGITKDAAEPREYRRVKTTVYLEGGGSLQAWVWEWIGDLSGSQPLDGEDWLPFEPNPS